LFANLIFFGRETVHFVIPRRSFFSEASVIQQFFDEVDARSYEKYLITNNRSFEPGSLGGWIVQTVERAFSSVYRDL
jgi:hypothetical protein